MFINPFCLDWVLTNFVRQLNYLFVALCCTEIIIFNIFQEKLSSTIIIETSDVTSAKLGLPNGAPQCATCGSQSVRDCNGE